MCKWVVVTYWIIYVCGFSLLLGTDQFYPLQNQNNVASTVAWIKSINIYEFKNKRAFFEAVLIFMYCTI